MLVPDSPNCHSANSVSGCSDMIDKNARHRICCMRCMWRVCSWVPHHLTISMIRCYKHCRTSCRHSLCYLSYSAVNSLNGFYRCMNISRMPNHIRIGKIHDDQFMLLCVTDARTASRTPCADISGFKSYVAIEGEGTSCLSSPQRVTSCPPLVYKASHADIFASATLSCLSPAFETVSLNHFSDLAA